MFENPGSWNQVMSFGFKQGKKKKKDKSCLYTENMKKNLKHLSTPAR